MSDRFRPRLRETLLSVMRHRDWQFLREQEEPWEKCTVREATDEILSGWEGLSLRDTRDCLGEIITCMNIAEDEWSSFDDQLKELRARLYHYDTDFLDMRKRYGLCLESVRLSSDTNTDAELCAFDSYGNCPHVKY